MIFTVILRFRDSLKSVLSNPINLLQIHRPMRCQIRRFPEHDKPHSLHPPHRFRIVFCLQFACGRLRLLVGSKLPEHLMCRVALVHNLKNAARMRRLDDLPWFNSVDFVFGHGYSFEKSLPIMPSWLRSQIFEPKPRRSSSNAEPKKEGKAPSLAPSPKKPAAIPVSANGRTPKGSVDYFFLPKVSHPIRSGENPPKMRLSGATT